MLDATKLMRAATPGSHGGNQFIMGLLEEVNEYNAIVSPMNTKPKADQLQRICQIAGYYCTSKPPQPPKPDKPFGGKNALRWDAVKDLLDQVGGEVALLGLRMLTGPSDFKKIGAPTSGIAATDPAFRRQSYWLEFIDPLHRPGFKLAPDFETWMKDATCIREKRSFWDHMATQDISRIKHTDQKVKYYIELINADATYTEDRGFLNWLGDRLFDDKVPWDTTNTETHFSGKGWGIFVVSPDGNIYGGTHQAGVHHHSSFLDGGMVMAAGEIACYGGYPRIITAKSGHYAPTVSNMRNFVRKFAQIKGDSIIQPRVAPVFYRIQDFRDKGLDATPLTKAELTPFFGAYPVALSGKFRTTTWDKIV